MCFIHTLKFTFWLKCNIKFRFLTLTMSSINDIGASFAESAKARREKASMEGREKKRPPCIQNGRITGREVVQKNQR